MRFEILIQFIVPLTFLAIWALTSILNRDAQPLPPGPGRAPAPGGPRPLNRLPGLNDPRPPAQPIQPVQSARPLNLPPVLDRPAGPISAGTSAAARPRPRPRTGLGLDDAIVYIENDPANRGPRKPASAPAAVGPAAAPRLSRGGQVRRGNRVRPPVGTQPAQSRAESETHRALSDQMNQARALQKAKPLEITPLSSTMAPLSESSVAQAAPRERGTAPPPVLTVPQIRQRLASYNGLREAFVLSELLQPPLALRRGT